MLAVVPQASVLGPLFLNIYVNDLSKNLIKHTKLFVDDISIFSAMKNIGVSTDQVNSDLEKNSSWAHQWKMLFNPYKEKNQTCNHCENFMPKM